MASFADLGSKLTFNDVDSHKEQLSLLPCLRNMVEVCAIIHFIKSNIFKKKSIFLT